MAATWAMDRLSEAGHSARGSISIVGYDNASLAQLRQVSLTTVNQLREAMGRAAVQTGVLERLKEGPQKPSSRDLTHFGGSG